MRQVPHGESPTDLSRPAIDPPPVPAVRSLRNMRSRFRSPRRHLLALTILLLQACNLSAQTPDGPETVIRAETRVVLVDAVVLDRKQQFVRDLRPQDFRLWEDGKEQKLTSFSLESAGVSQERSNKHYIALFFDNSTGGQTSQVAMRREASHFVDGFASPDRYMAVINYGQGLSITQNFTADADRLRKALNVVQSSAASNAGLVRDVPRPTVGGANNTTSFGMDVDTSPYRNLLASVRALTASLATIKGRKALVLFTGGAAMTGDLTPDVKATIDAANKANVALYTVGSSVSGGADAMPQAAPNQRLTVADIRKAMSTTPDATLLQALSDGTGGIAYATTNDLAASLGKVAIEQDQYYLLGYTPSVEAAEGTCHELNVKVARSDLEIRARQGYCTSKPADPLSGKVVGQDLEARAATGAAGNITAAMQLPWFYSQPGVAQVNLAMEINPSAMKFHKDKGKLRGEFDLAGVAYRADNSVAARFSDTVKLDFDTQQQADAFLKSIYHYENQFRIGAGQYNFRVAFTSRDQSFGKAEMPLKIDPWNGQTLSLGGLALSRDTHPSADIAAGLDAALLEGPRPLAAKGSELVPTGNNHFRTGERGFFYTEIYEPLLAAATDTNPDAKLPLVGMRIRVLDRATQAAKDDTGVKAATSFMRPGNPVAPMIMPLPTATLPAGQYTLEVTAMRETGAPVVRTADFDVN